MLTFSLQVLSKCSVLWPTETQFCQSLFWQKRVEMKINEDFKRAEHEFTSSKPSQASLFILAASRGFCLLSQQISQRHSVSSVQNLPTLPDGRDASQYLHREEGYS